MSSVSEKLKPGYTKTRFADYNILQEKRSIPSNPITDLPNHYNASPATSSVIPPMCQNVSAIQLVTIQYVHNVQRISGSLLTSRATSVSKSHISVAFARHCDFIRYIAVILWLTEVKFCAIAASLY